MIKKVCISLLVIAFSIYNCSGALAQSRSATFRVSCTVAPILEVSTAPHRVQNPPLTPVAISPNLEIKTADNAVAVRTNLGENYTFSETLLNRPEGRLKLYSVTAL